MNEEVARDRVGPALLLALPLIGSIVWVTLRAGPTPATGFANYLVAGALLAATAFFAWRERTSARLRSLLVVGAAGHLCFLGATVLFGIHLVAVLADLFGPDAEPYDFRSYSLLLLGVVGVTAGVMGAGGTPGVVRGERPALQRCTRAALWLLALNVPLIPLMGFATAFAVAGVSLLALITLARSAFPIPND